ncbi:MAG: metallophosphoesterase [Planctomycetes bacterium]|nr:metallophosphoesterase [Planctomycetota bacterium]
MRAIATSTLPAMIFGGIVLLVFYLYFRLWAIWLYRKIRKQDSRRCLTSRNAIILHIIAGIGIVCILYGYFIEPYWPEINRISIQTDKLKKTTFRVVQISDLHCDNKVRLEKTLPGIINGLDPDLIVFTGDAINRESALPLFQDTMRKLHAQLGKFAVNGNCDSYWSNLKLFNETGFEELRLHERIVEKDGESISISGLAFENGKNSFRVVGKLKPENFNLFLYHNTTLVDYFDDIPIDLYLCGHTHGGQVALPFYGALTTLSRHGKQYEAGLYRKGHIQLYVNRGIGMEAGWSPKVRFCSRPEITVFDIGPKTE